ncbi:substrate-binding domain-containing protein [Buttiauxella izardii]|uniref:LacI family DNA-binding transcriptional regulator n=1 Tax=Buttiauxella izardii TaxID=82991 RepID=A0A3A5JRM6_9ENTR|nr:substrate-binding domain-containing protein [Buttiauxella izardii]RJT18011.1 LacI family DNA-binding transcriptional regulator [Buttiauxella izardii]
MAKTIEQIATDLGVSITTVRAVLNGNAQKYRISEKTQERINSYVKKHSYTINLAARSLKLNKTDTFGLVIPRLSNPFFSALAELLEARCREQGYQLMISCTNNDTAYENLLVKSLENRNVDGIFVVSTNATSQAHYLKHCLKPLVFLDRDFGVEGACCVVTDNVDSGFRLTDAMLNHTHAPIQFFVGDPNSPSIVDRLTGYRAAMKQHGIKIMPEYISSAGHNQLSDGEKMMADYIDTHHRWPQHFIASSLPILQGALGVLRERYGYIPHEINIGTFDDNIMLSFLANNIWAMRQNEKHLAHEACQLMLEKLARNDEPPGSRSKAELVFRQSTVNARDAKR